ncbi:MAG: hypothetical protein ACUVSD_03500 [Thiobacillaceae bacterium]
MPYENANIVTQGVQGAGRAPLAADLVTRAPGSAPVPERPAGEREPNVRVQTRYAAYATLAGIKDEASQTAQAAREMHQALQAARTTVEAMRQAADAVLKQYPPFPPGSEQRLSYLRSIAALRQQLDAMTVPPRNDQMGPIFFPRSSDLPELDPSRATDDDVAAFGRALDALLQGVAAGQSKLRERVAALPDRLHETLPPPLPEPEVLTASQAAAADLSSRDAPLMRDAEGLAQIGG